MIPTEQVLAEFAAAARDEVDQEALGVAPLGAVDESMRPERIRLWLVPVQRGKWGRIRLQCLRLLARNQAGSADFDDQEGHIIELFSLAAEAG